MISGHVASSAHDFDTVTDDGYIRNHREGGEYLYGIDIAVSREYQGYKLARRLYEARKELVVEHNLKGIVIGGRIPGYQEHSNELSADEYVEKVVQRELDDPVTGCPTCKRVRNYSCYQRLFDRRRRELRQRGSDDLAQP